ncbi:hypothetical protein NBRC111894_1188 [Sporolactobacillus inulinus]|uniref:Uncharacterized protein n=1 Tax=Sporolactobacillus inulinus TaxID=2078 RepID=A0A4Y1Z9E6_9BACL|nr:hypothetical protein NBRC111894_1188 [Sporolactobacillus inulinus]
MHVLCTTRKSPHPAEVRTKHSLVFLNQQSGFGCFNDLSGRHLFA